MISIRDEKINKINEALGSNLANSISFLANEQEEKDKLIYTTFLHYHEKVNHSKSELKKCQEEMLECPPFLAPYVTSIIYSFDTPHVDDRLPAICNNFLTYEVESLAEAFINDYNTVEEIENDNYLNFDFYFLNEEFSHVDYFIVVIHFFQLGHRIANLKALIKDADTEEMEESKKNNTQNDTNRMIIEDKNLEIFKTTLEYNYPMDYSPITFYIKWKSNLSHLKKEVFQNLIAIPQDGRKPYLNSLKFQFEELLENCQTTKEELDKIYFSNNTNENELLKNRSYENPLHIALNSMPETHDDLYKEEHDPNFGVYQQTFYNYHYGKTINDAIDFLNEQEREYSSSSKQKGNKPVQTKPKETNNSIKSFAYINLQSGQENIANLLNALKKLNLVSDETETKHFKSVFSNKVITHKITWTGNISELAFFIKTIHNTAKKVHNTKQKLWEITVNCFQMDNCNILEQSKLRGQKIPARSNEIETAIINNL